MVTDFTVSQLQQHPCSSPFPSSYPLPKKCLVFNWDSWSQPVSDFHLFLVFPAQRTEQLNTAINLISGSQEKKIKIQHYNAHELNYPQTRPAASMGNWRNKPFNLLCLDRNARERRAKQGCLPTTTQHLNKDPPKPTKTFLLSKRTAEGHNTDIKQPAEST